MADPGATGIATYCAERLRVTAPETLLRAYASEAQETRHLMYRTASETEEPTIDSAFEVAATSAWPLPKYLVPILPVDSESLACVVVTPIGDDTLPGEGAVVRWHMGARVPEHQANLLDSDATTYVDSVAEELRARPAGLRRMFDEIGPAYERGYLDAEKRPRDFILRPVRLACQNVLVGLAAFAHDSSIDGMSVVAWQTCEVSHVFTHEGNRALAALTLCDAFQSGGTMEIRFDRPAHIAFPSETSNPSTAAKEVRYRGHPEMQVPASLRRYGRSVGISLGLEDPACISPSEARDLFLAVTPMPDELAARVRDASVRGLASAERLCFTLLSQLWREVELDFLLAVSDRAGSILRGGTAWKQRPQRQAESNVARAALIAGMLHRRLDTKDLAASDGQVRVLEDNRVGVAWSLIPEHAAIVFEGMRRERVPWQSGPAEISHDQRLVVMPRPFLVDSDLDSAGALCEHGMVAIAVPFDAEPLPIDSTNVLVLRCPDRLAELDLAIEGRLLTARIARS